MTDKTDKEDSIRPFVLDSLKQLVKDGLVEKVIVDGEERYMITEAGMKLAAMNRRKRLV